jgi:hypothetical protein
MAFVYEVTQGKDHRGVVLISDALPFGRLWYGEPNAVSNAVAYASKQKHRGNACKDLALGLTSNKTYPGPL